MSQTPLERHQLAVEYFTAKGTSKEFRIQLKASDVLGWVTLKCPRFLSRNGVYRREPQEPVVRYANVYPGNTLYTYNTERDAQRNLGSDGTAIKLVQDMDYQPPERS